MKIINIDAQTFEEMIEKFNAFTRKVDSICDNHKDKALQDWIDNQDVCTILNISKRSLQTYRDNGTLPYTQIGHKMYYKPEDVEKIMPFIAEREKDKRIKRKERNI